ncbi:hypothetical protein HRbin02_00434 [Candidatus Calditenuaceae archaeon HR02]|nr:hypothetical protein HRbin02_00434 [Candidatus Calditenuaceae archaeon HR02]
MRGVGDRYFIEESLKVARVPRDHLVPIKRVLMSELVEEQLFDRLVEFELLRSRV